MASWSPSWPAAVCFHLGHQLGPDSTSVNEGNTDKIRGQTCPNVRRRHRWLRETPERGNASDGGGGLVFRMCVCVSRALRSLKRRFWDNNRMRPSHEMSQIIWLSHMAAAEIRHCSSRRGKSSPSVQRPHLWTRRLYNPSS